MVFSSLPFLFRFLPAVLLCYFLLPRQFRNFFLFLASLIFYAWGEPLYLWLMLFSTIVDYTHGLLVDKFKRDGRMTVAKCVVLSSAVINLALLGYFKYAGFAVSTVNSLFGLSLTVPKIALPIGISFYTFQTMSYTIDVYRGDAKPQKNIIDFGAYVALFPQLIAGPIVQYKTIAEQLNSRRETVDDFAEGVKRFILGLGKKVLLANSAGAVWDTVRSLDGNTLPILTAWLGIAAYTFQIYFDFSGYSDMAIGLGKMFGFHFLENFNYPYTSSSITEFWRRWHISLGTWFKEYVYIPLGGNRRGRLLQFRNIAVVWFLTGLWHGASWNFIAWGVYFGTLLIIEKVWLLKLLQNVPKWVSHCYTMLLVMISWVIFAIDDIREVFRYLGRMFGTGGSFYDTTTIYLLLSNLLLFCLLIIGSTPIPAKASNFIRERLTEKSDDILSGILQNIVYIGIFLLSVAYLVSSTYNPFLYFRF